MPNSTGPIDVLKDPMEVLKNELFFLYPEIALALIGLFVLIIDFSSLGKKSAHERRTYLGVLTLGGVLLTLVFSVAMLLPTPYGFDMASRRETIFSGTLAVDGTSAWMNCAVLGLLLLVVAQSMAWDFTEHWGEYYALLCWAGVGMMFLIAAEELLTLFLTLETMTLCLYMITAFEKGRRRSAEGGLKYFVYGSVSSALFLFGLSLIYGLTGTTSLGAIRMALQGGAISRGLTGDIAGSTAVLLILVGFGFKIAAVPFHQWAPDAYEGAPAPVSAWVATGSKLASFVAMLKVFVGAFAPWASRGSDVTTPGWIGIVAVIAAVTMTYGNFAALAQKNFKRMLAYSSIAHAGYLLVGVLAASLSADRATASAPVLFYLVVYAFTTAGAFAVAAWLVKDKGDDRIADLDGLGARSPMLAVCIVILMLSLIGMPPMAGFFGKLYMFMEAMNTGEKGRLPLTWLVGLGLFNSVVSAFYYVRVLKAMFLRPSEGTPSRRAPIGVGASILAATLVAIGFGLYPAPLLSAMQSASSSRTGAPGPAGREAFNDFDPEAYRQYKEEQEEAMRKLKEEAKKKGIRTEGGPPGARPG